MTNVLGGDQPAQIALARVQRPRQQVEDQLRQAILSGALGIGRKLPPEAGLAVEFGVSRTTVREALRSLAADGLIEKVPGAGGGSFVRGVDHHSLAFGLSEDIENLIRLGSVHYEEAVAVRRLLEVPAARSAAVERSDVEIAELEGILAQEESLTAGDPLIPELEARFHSVIAHASGNRMLAAFVFALHQVTGPVSDLGRGREVGKRTCRHHRTLLGAIDKQDPDAAAAAMLSDLRHLDGPSQGQRERLTTGR